MQRREVYYRGTVQGVGFRYATRRLAADFAVTGFVKNLPDGRVLLVAEGRGEEIDRFLEAVRAAFGGYVSDIREAVVEPTGEFRSFDIRY